MLEQYDEILTVEEVCEILRVGKNALYEMLLNKRLKGYRNGRVWRIPKRTIAEYIMMMAHLRLDD